MKIISFVILIGLSALLMANPIPMPLVNQETGEPITLVTPPENFVVNSIIPINIIFIGFNESLIDTSLLAKQMMISYIKSFINTFF